MLRVECYAGYRGDETPRAVVIDGRRVEVVEVLDRWRTPEHHGFRLRGDDGRAFVVRQDVRSGAWELMRAGRHTD